MLRTRVITAIVLLAVLFAILSYGGPQAWLAFVVLVVLAGLWEWAKLGQFSSSHSLLYALGGTIACGVGYSAFDFMGPVGLPIMAISAIFWVAYAPLCLKKNSMYPLSAPFPFLVLGWVVISSAALALLLARHQGIVFLISALSICWVADIFAYFVGKLLGKNKLAPNISPGKSWEGAIGGACFVLVSSWLIVFLAKDYPLLQSSWQYLAYRTWHPLIFSGWLFILTAFSVVGDLFESMLKRAAGVKDSGHLLPGHGGVLDRIDAQLPVLPLLILLVGKQVF